MRTRETDVEPFVNLSELTEIELLIMRRMREFTIGEHRSLFTGSGFDFVGLRDWQPGDRTSNIDWAQSTLTNFSPMIVRDYEQRSTATVVAIADSLARGAAPGWIWTHFPAGEKRSEKTAALLKRMGVKPGFSDFLLISPNGRHHWLEIKRGLMPLSEHQEAHHRQPDQQPGRLATLHCRNAAIDPIRSRPPRSSIASRR
jgi:uncharacterized protein (DUF58 family)